MINIIKEILDKEDPIELLKMGCPKDEYESEAEIIAHKIQLNGSIDEFTIQDILKTQFLEIVDINKCREIAEKINIYIK